MEDLVGYVSMRHSEVSMPRFRMSLSHFIAPCLDAGHTPREQIPKLGCFSVEL